MQRYLGYLPLTFIPIGEAPGGNLLCIDASGAVYLWGHESRRGEEAWRVASSVDKFVENLEPDASDVGGTDGIVASESFLDF